MLAAQDAGSVSEKGMCGTPYYMAPEQCSGLSYDSRADVWSLGCVLFELCSLKRAISARTGLECFWKITRGERERLPSNRDMSDGGTGAAGYSTAMRALVDATLSQDPAARPTAADLVVRPYVAERLGAWASVGPAIAAAEAGRRQEDARAHVVGSGEFSASPAPAPSSSGGSLFGGVGGAGGSSRHGGATAGSMFLSDFFDPDAAPSGLAGLEMRLNWNRLMTTCNRCFRWGGGQHWPRMAEHLLFTETRGPATGFDLEEICAGGEGEGAEFFVGRTGDGKVVVWGCGADGRLGLGVEPDTLASLARAQRAAPLSTAAAAIVRAGLGANPGALASVASAAVTTGGGDHDEEASAALRKRVLSANRRKPVMLGKFIREGHEIVQIAAGKEHAAAVSAEGQLWLWGDLSLHENSGLKKRATRSREPQPLAGAARARRVDTVRADGGCDEEGCEDDNSSDDSDWPEWAKQRRSSLGSSSQENPFALAAVEDDDDGDGSEYPIDLQPKANPFALPSSEDEEDEQAPAVAPNPFALPESDGEENDVLAPTHRAAAEQAAQAGGLRGIVAFLLKNVDAELRAAVEALPVVQELGISGSGDENGVAAAAAAAAAATAAVIDASDAAPAAVAPATVAATPPPPPMMARPPAQAPPVCHVPVAPVDAEEDDTLPEDSCFYEPMCVTKLQNVERVACGARQDFAEHFHTLGAQTRTGPSAPQIRSRRLCS